MEGHAGSCCGRNVATLLGVHLSPQALGPNAGERYARPLAVNECDSTYGAKGTRSTKSWPVPIRLLREDYPPTGGADRPLGRAIDSAQSMGASVSQGRSLSSRVEPAHGSTQPTAAKLLIDLEIKTVGEIIGAAIRNGYEVAMYEVAACFRGLSIAWNTRGRDLERSCR